MIACNACSGSGEGPADGSNCYRCKGEGELMVACADCGDADKEVVIDSYDEPLCPACTHRRINDGCDDAERTAFADATRQPRRRRDDVTVW